jgi:hypothetical protein
MFRTATTAPAIAGAFMAFIASAETAAAEAFNVVSSRDSFVSLIEGRELRRFGIRLTVTPDGTIQGRAFGTPVTGQWNWNDGYFCRDLFYGEDDLGLQLPARAGERRDACASPATRDRASMPT